MRVELDPRVRNIASLLNNAALTTAVQKEVMTKCNLQLELGNTLCDVFLGLYGGGQQLQEHHGHVTFRDLQEFGPFSRGLRAAALSLRLKKLNDAHLMVLESIPKSGPGSEFRKGQNSSRAWVRITKAGIEKAEMILSYYNKLAQHLLAHVDSEDLTTHLAVTEIVTRLSQAPILDVRKLVDEVLAQSKKAIR
jgi:hypothetical protein